MNKMFCIPLLHSTCLFFDLLPLSGMWYVALATLLDLLFDLEALSCALVMLVDPFLKVLGSRFEVRWVA